MRKSKSSLFLMELIIVVLFFALTSAVCLQVFVKAHSVDRETKSINNAVMWGDNLSELFYEYGNDLSSILSQFTDNYLISADSSNEGIIYLDKDFRVTSDSAEAAFEITVSTGSDNRYNYLNYSFTDILSNNNVFSFTYKANIQEVIK